MSFFAIIALIMGAWTLLIGIPLMMNNKSLHAMLDDMAKPGSGMLSMMLMTIAFGVIILSQEYRLMGENWMWVVPLIGWLSLIKGVFFIFSPNTVKYMVKNWYNPGTTNMIWGLIIVLLGAFFLWLAFNVY
jgi:hypothetical protein